MSLAAVVAKSGEALREGKLLKRGPTAEFAWKPRHCRLVGSTLACFADDSCTDLKGEVRLTQWSDATTLDRPELEADAAEHQRARPHAFVVLPDSRACNERRRFHYFDAESRENRDSWLDVLNSAARALMSTASTLSGGVDYAGLDQRPVKSEAPFSVQPVVDSVEHVDDSAKAEPNIPLQPTSQQRHSKGQLSSNNEISDSSLNVISDGVSKSLSTENVVREGASQLLPQMESIRHQPSTHVEEQSIENHEGAHLPEQAVKAAEVEFKEVRPEDLPCSGAINSERQEVQRSNAAAEQHKICTEHENAQTSAQSTILTQKASHAEVPNETSAESVGGNEAGRQQDEKTTLQVHEPSEALEIPDLIAESKSDASPLVEPELQRSKERRNAFPQALEEEDMPPAVPDVLPEPETHIVPTDVTTELPNAKLKNLTVNVTPKEDAKEKAARLAHLQSKASLLVPGAPETVKEVSSPKPVVNGESQRASMWGLPSMPSMFSGWWGSEGTSTETDDSSLRSSHPRSDSIGSLTGEICSTVRSAFTRIDPGGKGMVTREDAQGMWSTSLVHVFDEIDDQGRGYITLEDVAQFCQQEGSSDQDVLDELERLTRPRRPSTTQELSALLEKGGVSTWAWTKARLRSLLDEILLNRCTLTLQQDAAGTSAVGGFAMMFGLGFSSDDLQRSVRIVRVRLTAPSLRGDVDLVEDSVNDTRHGYTRRGRDLTKKIAMWQDLDRELEEVLRSTLHLNPAAQKQHLRREGHRTIEETQYSPSYPGLLTCYRIEDVRLRLVDVEKVPRRLGLPKAEPFATSRGDIFGCNRTWSWKWAPASNAWPPSAA